MTGCAVGKIRSRNLLGVIKINLASSCLTVGTAKKAQGSQFFTYREEVEKKSTLCRNRTCTQRTSPSSLLAHGLHSGRDLVQSAHVSRRLCFADCHDRRRPNRIAGYPGPPSP